MGGLWGGGKETGEEEAFWSLKFSPEHRPAAANQDLRQKMMLMGNNGGGDRTGHNRTGLGTQRVVSIDFKVYGVEKEIKDTLDLLSRALLPPPSPDTFCGARVAALRAARLKKKRPFSSRQKEKDHSPFELLSFFFSSFIFIFLHL